MSAWSKYPFLRILIPFALGVWCCVCIPVFRPSGWLLLAAMLVLFVMAALTVFMLKSYRYSWLFGVIMAFYLFCAGYALTRFHEASVKKDYYRNFEADAQYYVARLSEYPSERENSVKVTLQLEYQIGDSLPSRPVSGRVMAYFQKTDSALALHYGDVLVLSAPIGEVSPPKNPEEFDYRAYLKRKGITGQVYLKDTDWMGLKVNNANPLYAFSYRFRDMLLASLQRCGLKGNEFGVAAAILLGYDESLADEMRHKYVAAGSMHILCVSGMHVGIIYLVASFLLAFLNRKRWQKVLKNMLLLLLVWFYALIAGLSPSILRSTLMISLVIIGEMIRRKGFIINSIAASAFILLCVNPNNLFEIGFLLSYSAVIGIVVLQRPIFNLFYLKNSLLSRAWEVTSVALAAQIATIPFTLFYFNQFSIYFWLSNLFMTPISFIVVMGGMLLLMVSWIPYINKLVGYLVWGVIYVMNYLVSWVDGLPFSIIKGLYVNSFEFALMLVAFVLLMLFVTLRKRRMLVEMLSVLLVLMLSVTMRLYSPKTHDGMTFYSLRRHTAVDFICDGTHVLLADSTLMADESTVDYSLKGSWTKKNLSFHPEVIGLDADYDGPYLRKKANLLSFKGNLIALWDDALAVDDGLSYRLPVDYLLVTNPTGGGELIDLQLVTNNYKVKMLVIDGSVPNYKARDMKAQAERLGMPCHCLSDGALELSLN